MKDYLPYKHFVPYAPEYEDSIRKDHGFGCEGSSPALKIERRDDGSISAKCFRCGKSGFYVSDKQRINTIKKKNKGSGSNTKGSVSYSFNLPYDSEGMYQSFSIEARQWLNSYGITLDEIQNYGIQYSRRYNRLVLPVYKDSQLISYQTRRLSDDDEYSKYVTFWNKNFPYQGKLFLSKNIDNKIAIVEDYISGIKSSRYIDTYAMLGNHIPDEYKLYIIKNYNKVYIYLDNDSNDIKRKQSVLKNYFEFFNKEVILIKLDKDPKELSDNALKVIYDENE